jgi:hypothetical protein
MSRGLQIKFAEQISDCQPLVRSNVREDVLQRAHLDGTRRGFQPGACKPRGMATP